MYLIILEDSEIGKVSTLEDGDLEACEAGLIDIVDLSGEMPREYYAGEWHDIMDFHMNSDR